MLNELFYECLVRFGISALLLYMLFNSLLSVLLHGYENKVCFLAGILGSGERRKSRKAQTDISQRGLDLQERGLDEQIKQYADAQANRQRQRETGQQASQDYMQLFSQPSEYLTQMQDKIERGATKAQSLADAQAQTALAQANVPGPLAALERSRQAGMMQQNSLDAMIKLFLENEMANKAAQGKLLGETAYIGAQA